MRAIVFGVVILFSINSFAGWAKPIEEGRKPSQAKIVAKGELIGGWTYIEGEKNKYTDPKEVRDLFAAQIKDFANPFCLRDQLLRDELLQANVAIGNTVTRIDAESFQEENEGKGVLFRVSFKRPMSGMLPGTFCKMK